MVRGAFSKIQTLRWGKGGVGSGEGGVGNGKTRNPTTNNWQLTTINQLYCLAATREQSDAPAIALLRFAHLGLWACPLPELRKY